MRQPRRIIVSLTFVWPPSSGGADHWQATTGTGCTKFQPIVPHLSAINAMVKYFAD